MIILLLKRLTLHHAPNNNVLCCAVSVVGAGSEEMMFIGILHKYETRNISLLPPKTAQNCHQMGSATEA